MITLPPAVDHPPNGGAEDVHRKVNAHLTATMLKAHLSGAELGGGEKATTEEMLEREETKRRCVAVSVYM